MSVSFPTGGTFRELVTEWDRLVYASRGVLRVAASAGEWVVPPRRALWVPAGVRHRVIVRPGVRLRALYFRRRLSRRLPRECRVLGVPALLAELILHVARRAAADPTLASESRAIALLLELLGRIEVVPLQLPSPRDARAVRAVRALETGDGLRESLAEVARASGASPRTLQRLFLAETGLTFEKWRQRARLARAVELLADGESVTSVAFEVGYDSPSAFVAMFRRELGATPRRYVAWLGC